MKKLHKLEVEAFSRLGFAERYNYFLSKLSQWQEVWGLSDDDGWVVIEQDGRVLFPLWPAEAFAERCMIDNWKKSQPKSITIDQLISELLPDLLENNIQVAVFMVPNSESCGVLPAAELLSDCQKLQ